MKLAPLRILPVEPIESRPVQQWLTKCQDMTPPSPEGKRLLGSAIDYVHRIAQHARTQDEVEDFKAALWTLSAIRHGWSMPVLVAYQYCFGMHPHKFPAYRLQRHAMLAWQLQRVGKVAQPEAPKKLAKVLQMPRFSLERLRLIMR